MLTASNQSGTDKPSDNHLTKQAAHNPLTLRDWVYAADGKHIKELVKTSFLEFYFMRKTTKLAES